MGSFLGLPASTSCRMDGSTGPHLTPSLHYCLQSKTLSQPQLGNSFCWWAKRLGAGTCQTTRSWRLQKETGTTGSVAHATGCMACKLYGRQATLHRPKAVWQKLHDVQANLNGTSHRLYGRQGVWQRGCVEDKLPDRKATQVMWQTSCVADRLHGTGHRPFGRLSKGRVTDR